MGKGTDCSRPDIPQRTQVITFLYLLENARGNGQSLHNGTDIDNPTVPQVPPIPMVWTMTTHSGDGSESGKPPPQKPVVEPQTDLRKSNRERRPKQIFTYQALGEPSLNP